MHRQISSIYTGSIGENLFGSKPRSSLVPIVIEEAANGGERAFDIFSRLLKSNIVMVTGPIEDNMASLIKAQLLFLGSADEKNPIKMFIDSPGGSVSAGWGIVNVMQTIPNKVVTICSGTCASMGAIILTAGDERLIYENATVLIHQPLGGAQGQATEIEIIAREILRVREELYEFLAENTGQSLDKIREDCERDYTMTAKQAMAYGIVDHLVPSLKEQPRAKRKLA